MYLLIDNFDSFTFNIQAYFEELGTLVMTRRCDKLSIDDIIRLEPTGIILSPGPKRPEDATFCLDVVRRLGHQFPMLGVCLGMQVLAYAAGAIVTHGTRPMHGKCTPITHNGTGLFRGLPSPYTVTRYHSLVIQNDTLPKTYQIDASTEDGVIMAISHRTLPLYGVQFHPEAVCTEYGHEVFANFCRIAERKD